MRKGTRLELTVLTHTVSDVSSRVVSKLGLRGLEVDGLGPSGEVGSSKIGGPSDELRKRGSQCLEDDLGVLPRSDGGVSELVHGKSLLPSLGKLSGNSSSELGSLSGELLLVRGEEGVPLGVGLSSLLGDLLVDVVRSLGDGEELVGVHAELLLKGDNVVLFEGWGEGAGEGGISDEVETREGANKRRLTSSVNSVSSLKLGSESDGGGESDDSRLVGRLLGLGDGSSDTGKVAGEEEGSSDLVPSFLSNNKR